MQNYQLITDSIIAEQIVNKTRPKLLLHSCCAPCSSYVLEYLSQYFDITVFYYNPNIFPYEEYKTRLAEQQSLIATYNENNTILSENNPIKLIEGDYDYNNFKTKIIGLESEKEGGQRCHICYELRLNETAKKARENNFDYYTTTLTVSPYKNAKFLNELGSKYAEIYQIKYLFSDFKKRNGYLRSIELSKIHNLYRQDYCGCECSQINTQTKREKL